MARPKANIDEAEVGRLAFEGARNSEIAALLGVDDQTLTNRFSRILTKKRAERRVELRKFQWEQAKAGNPTMLIWLGKNELEQKDKREIDFTDASDEEVIAAASGED